jgi:hypothetical protein
MQVRRVAAAAPTGLSFEIPDLLLLQAWAYYHDLRLDIELDCCIEDDEYEEMVALVTRATGFRRWMVWRSAQGIVVQPMVGRPMLFDSIADGLEVLIRAEN